MARILALLVVCLALSAIADQPIQVQTNSGAVIGRIGQTARFWKGVPYAAPPLGNLRWADSIAVTPWSSPIQTAAVSSGCPQVCDEPEGVCPDVQSEDCLYLNVYGPSYIPSGKLLPTMVFFHGGNYKIGHAGSNLYEASFMANVTNTIIVTVNYRLAALGYAVTNKLGGNYGISDQRLALKWVQSNIKFFNGDPGQVTIWGQSAGGGSVALHMISPASQGLFHRVISESNPISIEYKNRTEGIAQGNLLAKFMNCLDQAGNANEDCMRRVKWQDVLSAQVQVGHAMKPIPQPFKAAYPWSPSVGDPQGVLPMQPLDAILQGKFVKVPVLQGTVKEEGVQFVDMLFTSPVAKWEFLPLLTVIFGLNNTAAVAPLYPVPANESKDARETLIKITTHFTFRCGNRIAARALSKAVPFFFYAYDHALSFNPFGQNYSFCADRVCHGVELPMLFGTARLGGFTPTADEDQLTRRMMYFWGKFAYGATSTMPGPDGNAPAWPLFTEANDLNYLFDAPNVSIESHRDKMFCDVWDKVGYLKF